MENLRWIIDEITGPFETVIPNKIIRMIFYSILLLIVIYLVYFGSLPFNEKIEYFCYGLCLGIFPIIINKCR